MTYPSDFPKPRPATAIPPLEYVIRTEKLTDDPVMERDVALLKLLPQRFRTPATALAMDNAQVSLQCLIWGQLMVTNSWLMMVN